MKVVKVVSTGGPANPAEPDCWRAEINRAYSDVAQILARDYGRPGRGQHQLHLRTVTNGQ